MDSAVQLALMSKAKKVFGADDTFLSFPVSPLPHTRRQLEFFAQQDANALRESLQNLQAFSTLVNLIPSDEAWLPTETRFLWDVYEQVLKEAQFASSTRTAEEEAAYQQALNYLRVVGEGGVPEESAQVKAYRQYKDAYLVAQQKYLAAKSTAECATDPVEQQRWRDVDEPAQRAELDALQAQWIIAGNKNEVEAAQSRVVNLGARSPIQTWNEWSSRFNREIDTLTGAADNFTVFPTLFSPSNALEEGAWKPFKLSEQEVEVLLNEAPAELRERYAADSAASSVASVTFEFSSAAILRPWFASEALRARFWRFADPSNVLSDGGTPAKGECPAYVTAIVFARKVTVEQKPSTVFNLQATESAQGAKAFDGFRFTAAVRNPEMLHRVSPDVSSGTQLHAVRISSPAMSATTARAPAMAAASPRMMRTEMNVAAVRPAPATAQAFTARPLRLSTMAVTRLPPQLIPGTAPPASIWFDPSTQSPLPPDDAIYILAFICKALPKCPNPDPTLQW
jgi:hypothetical protein